MVMGVSFLWLGVKELITCRLDEKVQGFMSEGMDGFGFNKGTNGGSATNLFNVSASDKFYQMNIWINLIPGEKQICLCNHDQLISYIGQP